MASVSGTRGFSAMRLSILGSYERRLAHGAAVIIIGGLASGCSSDAMRFSYTDGMFTGATSNQRQIIAPNQPYPGDSGACRGGRRLAYGLGRPRRGEAGRSFATPVSRTALAPVAGTTVAAADSEPLVKVKNPRLAPAASAASIPPSPAPSQLRPQRPRAIRSAGRAPAARRSPPRKARRSTICRAASACRPTC